ncbi:MAG: hypothetical protein WDA47_09470 [Bacilli bacterium]
MSAGVFVTFWKLSNLSDGPRYHRDQVAFRGGGIDEFRKQFGNPRIVGYHEINSEGEISEASIMLNEKPPSINNASNPSTQPSNQQNTTTIPEGATFDPSMVTNQLQQNQAPVVAPEQSNQQLVIQPVQPKIKPKILKNGESYLKIDGDQVHSLVWEEYDDAKSEFDRRIRATIGEDGSTIKIEHTVWRELDHV